VDPSLYDGVPLTERNAPGYDPRRCRGSRGAWESSGWMLKHGIPDLRMMFENDLRLLEQF